MSLQCAGKQRKGSGKAAEGFLRRNRWPPVLDASLEDEDAVFFIVKSMAYVLRLLEGLAWWFV